MTRDKTLEGKTMLASDVDLKIRNNMFSDSIQQFLPVSFSDGKLTSYNGQIQILPMEQYRDRNLNCNPKVMEFTQQGPRIINKVITNADFFMLRFMQINEQCNMSLDNDYKNAAHIGKVHNLTGAWDSTSVQDNGPWKYLSTKQNLFLNHQDSFYMHVYDPKNIFAFTIKVCITNSHNYIILPVAYFQHPLYVGLLELYLPPDPSCYTLLGGHHLENPDCSVCITNDFTFYMNNIKNPDMLFLLNVGGDAWIDKLNFDFLKNRKVFCHAWGNDKISINSALMTTANLKSIGIKPDFHITSIITGANQYLESNNTRRR